jgi:hypothetical protein
MKAEARVTAIVYKELIQLGYKALHTWMWKISIPLKNPINPS